MDNPVQWDYQSAFWWLVCISIIYYLFNLGRLWSLREELADKESLIETWKQRTEDARKGKKNTAYSAPIIVYRKPANDNALPYPSIADIVPEEKQELRL